jgi:phosphoserine phosphatase RsbU/P
MKLNERAASIAQIALFASLPASELERLAQNLRSCQFSAGERLIYEGRADERFYILTGGEVEVIKALGTPDERCLAQFSSGQGVLLGEMSLFNPQGCHTASVRAVTTVLALEMSRADFESLLQRRPALVYEMLRIMSQRLVEAEQATILDLREKNRQLYLAYEELKEAQVQIILKEKMEKELSIARQIQESILPESLPHLKGFDLAALTYPARAVGGDYYDFFPLEDGRIGIVVGDACDKGVPAALFINLTNSLVRVEARRNTSPEAVLRTVNQHLIEVNRAEMFASLIYGVLDESGRFEYCRAGHPYPLGLDQNQARLEIQRSNGMPLGFDDEVDLDVQALVIPVGGMLVLFSDGLSEAMDVHNNEFSEQRLAEMLPALSRLPAAEICPRIWSQVRDFAADAPQSDDFTVVVIKREAG